MMLLEGGVGGHMSHLYDNPRLTFATIKKVLQAASEGQLEGTEKTDGQNLFISFSVPEQKAKGARNKSNIKDGGLDAKDLAKKFAGRGPLEKTFSEALAAFEEVVSEMPRAQQIQIFGPNTNVYFSAEIIDPRSTNLINYDTKTLAIHRGGAEFSRETGDPIEIEVEDPNYPGELMKTTKDVSTNAELLDSLLKDKQEDIKKRDYGVEMDAIKILKGLEDDTALDLALDELEKEISSEGISDNQTVLEYVMAKISNWFQEEGLDLDPEAEKKVLQKILLTDPGYRYAYGYGRKLDKEWNKGAILKTIPPENREDARHAIDNAGSILKGAIAPIESIIHDFSVEMLKSLKSIFILDNEKELIRQRKEVETAIKAIEASGSEEAMTILQKQMEKLKRVENISTAAEGFVFDYDGHTYKFTGNFAPMNQLLGLFKYGRKGIPAMEKIDESLIDEVFNVLMEGQLEQEKYVILIPGGFKPPHKGHKEMIENYAAKENVEKVVVISGEGSPREGVTRDMSEKVFRELYKLDNPKIEFINSGASSPMAFAFELLGHDLFTEYHAGATISLGCSNKADKRGVPDSRRAEEFAAWILKDGKKQQEARDTLELYDVKVGVYPACDVASDGDIELSASKLRRALMIGDDNMIRAHLPSDVDIEDFKAIVNISDTAPALQEGVDFSELLYNIIEEVLEENKYAICTTSIGKTAGTTKRSEWSDADEKRYEKCKDDLEENKEELEEMSGMAGGGVSIGSGPFPGIAIKRRKKSKRRSKAN
jgi:hypothetical protein